ncbi:MAG: hypothetical protein HYY40_11635 [Bacteroidetes bacterium]|nr:hypothetical protein [Bacteroidota bacterium]
MASKSKKGKSARKQGKIPACRPAGGRSKTNRSKRTSPNGYRDRGGAKSNGIKKKGIKLSFPERRHSAGFTPKHRLTEPDVKKLFADDDPELLDMAQRERVPTSFDHGDEDRDADHDGETGMEKDKFLAPEDQPADLENLSDEEDEDDF